MQTPRHGRAGEELAAFRLPAPLRCLAVDPGEHALYAGGGDGCIFEVSLLHGGGGGADAGVSGASGATSRHTALEGHSAAVTALALTTDGLQLVSGRVACWPVKLAVRCTGLVIYHVPIAAVAVVCSKTSRCSVQKSFGV